MITLRKCQPAGARFSHGNGSNAGASHHSGYELLDLLLGAVVCDVGHDDVRVQSKPWASAVHVGPVQEKGVQKTRHKKWKHSFQTTDGYRKQDIKNVQEKRGQKKRHKKCAGERVTDRKT